MQAWCEFLLAGRTSLPAGEAAGPAQGMTRSGGRPAAATGEEVGGTHRTSQIYARGQHIKWVCHSFEVRRPAEQRNTDYDTPILYAGLVQVFGGRPNEPVGRPRRRAPDKERRAAGGGNGRGHGGGLIENLKYMHGASI